MEGWPWPSRHSRDDDGVTSAVEVGSVEGRNVKGVAKARVSSLSHG
jgi:hypothetical protein